MMDCQATLRTLQAREVSDDASVLRAEFEELDSEICEAMGVLGTSVAINNDSAISEMVARLEKLTDRIVQLERSHVYRRRR